MGRTFGFIGWWYQSRRMATFNANLAVEQVEQLDEPPKNHLKDLMAADNDLANFGKGSTNAKSDGWAAVLSG